MKKETRFILKNSFIGTKTEWGQPQIECSIEGFDCTEKKELIEEVYRNFINQLGEILS